MTDYTASPFSDDGGAHDGLSHRAHSLTLSFGRRATDNRPVARTLTFDDLILEFSTPDLGRGALPAAEYHALRKSIPEEKALRDREKDGPYFVPSRFKGDGRRCNDNVDALCGFSLDFDSGCTTEADIRRLLDGYTYLAYTSYSHQEDLEKWRVLVPYREPIARDHHHAVYRHFQDRFAGDVDPHCATPSQFWYTPACPPDAADLFRSFHALGELFDPGMIPDAVAPGCSPSPNSLGTATTVDHDERLRRLEGALRFISSDERKIWVDFGIAIKHDLGEAGLASWLGWSRKSPKFDLDDALKTWASFKEHTTGPTITLGTVFYMARERGWADGAASENVPEHITRINERHFLAPQGGKTLVFREGVHPFDGRHTLQGMSLPDFRALLSNEFVDDWDARGKPKRTSVAESWLSHPMRRQYEGLVLDPSGGAPGYYNRWRGLAVAPREGSWDLMREHIRVILCNGDERVFEYVLNWLALCVQRPGLPAEVAIVMCGGRGSGKGIVVRAVGSLFGQHFKHISQARHLTGNFNGHLEDCVVLFVDEGFWAGDKQGEAVLKHLITEPTITIERKGQEVEQVPNRLHMLIASNSDWVVPAGLDERRYLVLVVSDSKKQDATYFGALAHELENGGREAMLYDLLQRDIQNFNQRQVPSTTGLVDQKLLSLEPHQQWYFERLQEGTLTGFKGDWEWVQTARVHGNYVEALKTAGVTRRASQTALGMRLRGLLPPGYPRRTMHMCTIENVPVRRWHYQLPPLDVCQKYFEALVGLQGYAWDGEDSGAAAEDALPALPF